MFTNYSQFLDQEGSNWTNQYQIQSTQSLADFVNNIQTLPKPNTNQSDYSQFTQNISKKMVDVSYPNDFSASNPFCPLCLKLVKKQQKFFTCQIKVDRLYLLHQKCYINQSSFGVKMIGEIFQNNIEIIQNIKTQQIIQQVQGRFFYVELALLHPINEKKFIKLQQNSQHQKNQFTFQTSQNQQDIFCPFPILIPLTDYNISITIHEISNPKGERVKYTKYVSFRHLKNEDQIIVKIQEISMKIRILRTYQQILKIMQDSNFKYIYGEYPGAILINSIKIQLPQEFIQSKQRQTEINQENSRNVIGLLQDKFQQSSNNDKKIKQQFTFYTDKATVQRLINTNNLVQFVKNSTTSRMLQSYLAQCTQYQISNILMHIGGDIVDLITHQYGNYMIQKLFQVCQPYQRISILSTIQHQLPRLIKNKQGTHTIQYFVDYITTHEECVYLVNPIRMEFFQLCQNNNATHYIQKLVKLLHPAYLYQFFVYVATNLYAFAINKNAMCIIKHMIRRLKAIKFENQGQKLMTNYQMQIIDSNIIGQAVYYVYQLIDDSFGNYVIQFCYQSYSLSSLQELTSKILYQFVKFAMGKFSSSVLQKCIAVYWIQEESIFKYLEQMTKQNILQLFRHKDGNRTLLQMMELLEGTDLWDKIYNLLKKNQLTKFYHDRWAIVLGTRTFTATNHLASHRPLT